MGIHSLAASLDLYLFRIYDGCSILSKHSKSTFDPRNCWTRRRQYSHGPGSSELRWCGQHMECGRFEEALQGLPERYAVPHTSHWIAQLPLGGIKGALRPKYELCETSSLSRVAII